MSEFLDYDSWCDRYMKPVTAEMEENFREFHPKIDLNSEVERMRRHEYALYLERLAAEE